MAFPIFMEFSNIIFAHFIYIFHVMVFIIATFIVAFVFFITCPGFLLLFHVFLVISDDFSSFFFHVWLFSLTFQ